jgi:Family of unknown function (DUF5752)
MNPFEIMDCSLLVSMSGLPPAFNLRELRERISVCSTDVLYHHFCETPLSPAFEYPDHRNDFAVWASRRLSDKVLAERLGAVDPYACASMEELRALVLEVIDERLSEVTMIPWARPGHEFYFMEAMTLVFDSGERIRAIHELPDAIGRMSSGSIYYHFVEARRRPPVAIDDFSNWIGGFGKVGTRYVEALRRIDFYFYMLRELRDELVNVLGPLRSEKS